MIKRNILEYINTFDDKDQVLLFLLNIRLDTDFKTTISDESFFKLLQDNIIIKDYVTSQFVLCVSIFEGDEIGDNIPLTDYQRIHDEVVTRIQEYRTLFKGYRIGSMGIQRDCIEKITNLLIANLDISFDDILNTTMYYLERENPDYIMNADNFINNGRTSKLLQVMEDLPTRRLL